MNILISTSFILGEAGGANTHIEDLRKILLKRNHEVTSRSGKPHNKHIKLILYTISLFNKPVYRKKLITNNAIKLFRGINSSLFDVHHSHDIIAAAHAPKNIPLVLTIHGLLIEEFEMQKLMTSALRKFMFDLEYAAISKADHIICVDKWRMDAMIQRYPFAEGKISIIHNTSTLSNKEFDISDKLVKKYIFCAKRLYHNAGINNLIHAFSKIDDPDIELWIAGGGPCHDELQNLINKENLSHRVKLLGQINDRNKIEKLTHDSMIVVVPSVAVNGVVEGTSISALEGMALAKPIVASDIGGLAELIKDGYNGFLVKPNDPQSLANAMNRLINEPKLCVELGKNALLTINSVYNVDKWIDKIEEVYGLVVKGK